MPPRTAASSRSSQLATRARSTARVVYARAAPVVRATGRAAARAAAEEKHTLTALAAAGALGYAEREGMLDNISMIDNVDPKVQVAVAAWLLAKFSKSKTASHVATGLACVALYDGVRNRG